MMKSQLLVCGATQITHFGCFGSGQRVLMAYDVEYVLFVQLVIAYDVLLQGVHIILEIGNVFFRPDDFHDVVTGHNAQLGTKGLQHP